MWNANENETSNPTRYLVGDAHEVCEQLRAGIGGFLGMELHAEHAIRHCHCRWNSHGMFGPGNGVRAFRRHVAMREVEVLAFGDSLEQGCSKAFHGIPPNVGNLVQGTVGIMVPVSVVFTIAVSRILYKKGVL